MIRGILWGAPIGAIVVLAYRSVMRCLDSVYAMGLSDGFDAGVFGERLRVSEDIRHELRAERSKVVAQALDLLKAERERDEAGRKRMRDLLGEPKPTPLYIDPKSGLYTAKNPYASADANVVRDLRDPDALDSHLMGQPVGATKG